MRNQGYAKAEPRIEMPHRFQTDYKLVEAIPLERCLNYWTQFSEYRSTVTTGGIMFKKSKGSENLSVILTKSIFFSEFKLLLNINAEWLHYRRHPIRNMEYTSLHSMSEDEITFHPSYL